LSRNAPAETILYRLKVWLSEPIMDIKKDDNWWRQRAENNPTDVDTDSTS